MTFHNQNAFMDQKADKINFLFDGKVTMTYVMENSKSAFSYKIWIGLFLMGKGRIARQFNSPQISLHRQYYCFQQQGRFKNDSFIPEC